MFQHTSVIPPTNVMCLKEDVAADYPVPERRDDRESDSAGSHLSGSFREHDI